MTSAGEAVFAWNDISDPSYPPLTVVVRHADGTEDPPQAIGYGAFDPSLATDANGGTLLAWDDGFSGVTVGERSAGQSTWSTTYVGDGAYPDVAENAGGDAAVAFHTARLSRKARRAIRRLRRVYLVVSIDVPGQPGRVLLVRRPIRLTG